MKKDIITAKRYAKSLLQTVKEDEINEIKEVFSSSQELYDVLCNPIISIKEKNEIVSTVFNQNSENIKNFLKLLIQNKRFNLFFTILEEFYILSNKLNNIVEVKIISAIELDSQTKERIEKTISDNLNKKILAKYDIDDSLIAGLIFKINDNILDSSLKQKFEDLKKNLI